MTIDKRYPLGAGWQRKFQWRFCTRSFSMHDLEEALPSACNYIFPQSWWLKAIRNVTWMKGLDLPTREPFYNWERLARDISRIDKDHFPGIDGLRNRKRIWQLISNMRRNDMFELGTRYSADHLSPYLLYVHDSYGWSWQSWTKFEPSSSLLRG